MYRVWLLVLVLAAASVLLEAAVIMALWNWVIVPIFGIGAISFIGAIGLALVLYFVAHWLRAIFRR